jgi:hypothetical protein
MMFDLCKFEQENVLGESKMMVPDCKKRLEAALNDLQAILVRRNFDIYPTSANMANFTGKRSKFLVKFHVLSSSNIYHSFSLKFSDLGIKLN